MRESSKPKNTSIDVSLDSRNKSDSSLRPIGGSDFDAVNNWLANQVIGSLSLPESWSKETRDKKASQAVSMMVGLSPKDEIEGMLCAQMTATHAASMEMLRRAMIPEQPFEVLTGYLAMSNKFSRTHAALADTLMRKRTGGQQRIVVERVQVAPGGQAVLGDVHQSLGGGCATEKATQSHEHATETGRLTASCEPALQGAIEADKAKVRSPSGAR
jgi:hypothetical protein